jgi:hypothetical protein
LPSPYQCQGDATASAAVGASPATFRAATWVTIISIPCAEGAVGGAMLASWVALSAPIFSLSHPGGAPASTADEGALLASWTTIRAAIISSSLPGGSLTSLHKEGTRTRERPRGEPAREEGDLAALLWSLGEAQANDSRWPIFKGKYVDYSKFKKKWCAYRRTYHAHVGDELVCPHPQGQMHVC